MTQPIHVLFVDDDHEFRSTVVRRFERAGFQVDDAPDGETALQKVQSRQIDVAVLDMMMPGMSGIELVENFKRGDAECEVIFLTGQGTIETAVTAMKQGAFDYLTKPFALKDLEQVIHKAYAHRQLKKENSQLREILQRSQPNSEMIGQSSAMRDVFRLIERAGPSDKAILIQGESGTGKELVARALHRCSSRAQKPMVVINCAALPEHLLESELFGHEKGSFTGAVSAKTGLFEVADNGTLFIDEIGEMPGPLQAKLLRVLEDGSLRRVGSVKERRVNVRLLAATNRNLVDEVTVGNFREDLYYRINVMSLELPPLRKREGDIPLLVDHFLGDRWRLKDDALQVLKEYDWPGNIRQLANVLERGKILADDGVICSQDLPGEVRQSRSQGRATDVDSDDLSTLERAKVVEVLRRQSGNKSRAAQTLGIERRKLYRLIEKYGIRDEEFA